MQFLLKTLMIGLLIAIPSTPVYPQSLPSEPGAAAPASPLPGTDYRWGTTSFSLSVGYRSDDLNWHIAGNQRGSDPNIRSELTWSDLTIHQLKLSNRTIIKERLYLRGYFNYGMIISGSNQDADYNGDDRTDLFSLSVNGVDGNNVWDGSIGAGPRFSFFDDTLVLIPLLGYGVSEQDLDIVDGNQVFTAPPARTPLGPIEGLDSRYETRWKGPWIGIDLLFSKPLRQPLFRSIEIMFSGEYHWVDYAADANWNLRRDYQHPVSFSHDANGVGWRLGASLLFETHTRWGFTAGMQVQEMVTDPGIDRIFYADGTTINTRLNEVSWRAFTFEAGISYSF